MGARIAVLGLVVAACCGAATASAQTTPLSIDVDGLPAKEAENLSGAACAAGPTGVCVWIGDEMRYARTFRLTGDRVTPSGDTIVLLPGEGSETDGEGVATDGRAYYLVGSHGMSKNGRLQTSRFNLYRIAADPATGAPRGEVEVSTRLKAALATTPPFSVWAEKPLNTLVGPNAQSHGVNIEGIAVRDGQMFLAFRGPVLDGEAYVLRVSVASVFSPAAPMESKAFSLRLGPGVGLRDIAAVNGGFLLLTGPEADADGPSEIYFWNGADTRPTRWSAVGNAPGVKPESLTVLSDAPSAVEVLLLSDGVAGGQPVRMRLRPIGR